MEEKIRTIVGPAPSPKTGKGFTLPFNVRLMRLGFRHLGAIAPRLVSKVASKLFFTPVIRKRPEWPADLLSSGQAVRVPFNGHALHGYRWGGEGQPLVLFVHGWENEAAHFQFFIQEILKQGFAVAAFDAPAHGNSRGQQQTNMFEYSLAVGAIFKHFGKIHTIIGHSMGGAASFYRCAKTPEIELENLVMISSPTDIQGIFTRLKQTLHISDKVIANMQNAMHHRFNIDRDIYDLTQLWNKVNAKRVLLVHDKNDIVVPCTDAQRLAEVWSKAQMLITENYGHNRIIREAEPIKEVVEFISQA
ncbi:TAP-like protein [Flexibacter flexilis DSM 6793]|uniref:TAP-like protein n=1 Tax=Flexibacter flexilis DSM 6793 TaxID=927664 RepID=A0A1I1IVV0_9BACT|nr:alpha/beta hydrolase [Flexibacter flexilis]SFC39842.1 TAP-like protein [Flexibacter flexilis DSM 6793]